MGWLINTALWIAVERGTLGTADIHVVTRHEPVYLSPVNVAEIQFGLELLRAGPQKQRAAAMLRRLRRKPLLRITARTAETFGQLAAEIRRAGKDPNVRINDLWLAAQAIEHECRLLTPNARDFADIPRLDLVVLDLSGR